MIEHRCFDNKSESVKGEKNAAKQTQQFTPQQQSSQFTQFFASFEQQKSFKPFIRPSWLFCFFFAKQLSEQLTGAPQAYFAAIWMEQCGAWGSTSFHLFVA